MKYLPPNKGRGFVALIALISMIAGAWMLWGFGAALFALGLFLAVDASSDEAIERITNTARCKS